MGRRNLFVQDRSYFGDESIVYPEINHGNIHDHVLKTLKGKVSRKKTDFSGIPKPDSTCNYKHKQWHPESKVFETLSPSEEMPKQKKRVQLVSPKNRDHVSVPTISKPADHKRTAKGSKYDQESDVIDEPPARKKKKGDHQDSSDSKSQTQESNASSYVDVVGLESQQTKDELSQLEGHHEEWTFSSQDIIGAKQDPTKDDEEGTSKKEFVSKYLRTPSPVNTVKNQTQSQQVSDSVDLVSSLGSEILEAADLQLYGHNKSLRSQKESVISRKPSESEKKQLVSECKVKLTRIEATRLKKSCIESKKREKVDDAFNCEVSSQSWLLEQIAPSKNIHGEDNDSVSGSFMFSLEEFDDHDDRDKGPQKEQKSVQETSYHHMRKSDDCSCYNGKKRKKIYLQTGKHTCEHTWVGKSATGEPFDLSSTNDQIFSESQESRGDITPEREVDNFAIAERKKTRVEKRKKSQKEASAKSGLNVGETSRVLEHCISDLSEETFREKKRYTFQADDEDVGVDLNSKQMKRQKRKRRVSEEISCDNTQALIDSPLEDPSLNKAEIRSKKKKKREKSEVETTTEGASNCPLLPDTFETHVGAKSRRGKKHREELQQGDKSANSNVSEPDGILIITLDKSDSDKDVKLSKHKKVKGSKTEKDKEKNGEIGAETDTEHGTEELDVRKRKKKKKKRDEQEKEEEEMHEKERRRNKKKRRKEKKKRKERRLREAEETSESRDIPALSDDSHVVDKKRKKKKKKEKKQHLHEYPDNMNESVIILDCVPDATNVHEKERHQGELVQASCEIISEKVVGEPYNCRNDDFQEKKSKKKRKSKKTTDHENLNSVECSGANVKRKKNQQGEPLVQASCEIISERIDCESKESRDDEDGVKRSKKNRKQSKNVTADQENVNSTECSAVSVKRKKNCQASCDIPARVIGESNQNGAGEDTEKKSKKERDQSNNATADEDNINSAECSAANVKRKKRHKDQASCEIISERVDCESKESRDDEDGEKQNKKERNKSKNLRTDEDNVNSAKCSSASVKKRKIHQDEAPLQLPSVTLSARIVGETNESQDNGYGEKKSRKKRNQSENATTALDHVKSDDASDDVGNNADDKKEMKGKLKLKTKNVLTHTTNAAVNPSSSHPHGREVKKDYRKGNKNRSSASSQKGEQNGNCSNNNSSVSSSPELSDDFQPKASKRKKKSKQKSKLHYKESIVPSLKTSPENDTNSSWHRLSFDSNGPFTQLSEEVNATLSGSNLQSASQLPMRENATYHDTGSDSNYFGNDFNSGQISPYEPSLNLVSQQPSSTIIESSNETETLIEGRGNLKGLTQKLPYQSSSYDTNSSDSLSDARVSAVPSISVASRPIGFFSRYHDEDEREASESEESIASDSSSDSSTTVIEGRGNLRGLTQKISKKKPVSSLPHEMRRNFDFIEFGSQRDIEQPSQNTSQSLMFSMEESFSETAAIQVEGRGDLRGLTQRMPQLRTDSQQFSSECEAEQTEITKSKSPHQKSLKDILASRMASRMASRHTNESSSSSSVSEQSIAESQVNKEIKPLNNPVSPIRSTETKKQSTSTSGTSPGVPKDSAIKKNENDFKGRCSDNTSFRCTRCRRDFSSVSDMLRHDCREIIKARSEDSARKLAKPTHKCDECGRLYIQRCHLLHHKRSAHLRYRPYVCDTCGMKFAEKQTLVVHERYKHTHEKPYECQCCSEKFFTSSKLHEHYKNSHNLLRKFQCSYCDLSYFFKNDLQFHQRSIHVKAQITAVSRLDGTVTLSSNLLQ